jgi:hypothetical protein
LETLETLPATKENGGLQIAPPHSSDAGLEAMKAGSVAEVQAAVVLAHQFPRVEARVTDNLIAACSRDSFAEIAFYKFPRGGQTVEGGSIRLAQEAARVWGNIRYGFFITEDTEDSRAILGWAWDLETNNRVSYPDYFKKMLQRKDTNGNTHWVVADERDLRELTNRRGAILIRNAIFSLLPRHTLDEALSRCQETVSDETKPEFAKRVATMLKAFQDKGVSQKQIEQKVGRPLKRWSRDDIIDLRGIFAALSDGICSKEEVFPPAKAKLAKKAPAEVKPGLSIDDAVLAGDQSEPTYAK